MYLLEPSAQAGCSRTSIFMRSLTYFNMFFFSKTGCHTKVKELSLLC